MTKQHTQQRRGRIGGAIAFVAAVTLALTGCSGSSTPDDDADGGGTLTVGYTTPESLNPAKAPPLFAPLTCIPYDSLLAENSDGSFSPRLATEWEVSEDGTTFDLTIREGVSFSDGDALNAEAVANSINYFIGANGPAASNYVGMTAEATDEYSVRVTSESPQPNFEMLFTEFYGGGCIISPTGVADPDSLETESHGVGPYVIDSVQTGVEIVYSATEDYYDDTRGYYDEIDVKIFDGDTSATQALLSGQISLWRADMSRSWDSVLADNDLTSYLGTASLSGLWIFDREGQVVPALSDVRVRQALNYAIDRDALTTAVYGKDAVAIVQSALTNWPSFDESLESEYPYDPDKAKALLAEAGYQDGFTLPITFFGFDQANADMAEAMGGYLSEIGVTLELRPISTPADLVPTLSSGSVAAAILPNGARTVFQALSDRHLEGGTNGLGLGQVDPELRTMVDEALASNTDEAWSEIVGWLVDNAFDVPIAQAGWIWVANDDIDLADAYIESSGRVDFARITPADG